MIHRIVIWILLAIILPDIYIYFHYSRRKQVRQWQRWLWWLPCAVMTVYTIGLASIRNFAPADLTWLNIYLFLLGLIVGPKVLFTLFSFIGWLLRKPLHWHHNYGHWFGLAAGLTAALVYFYGLSVGIGRIRVDHVSLSFKDLPKEFDGLRIVHISDFHVGTFEGWRWKILRNEIDSIRAQKTDLVLFTGDMQNMQPKEVERMMPILDELPYTYFILGNHDYAEYIDSTPEYRKKLRRRLISLERQLGRPLCNENVRLTRGKASIWIAGEENDGRPPFPSYGNIAKTMKGIPDSAFVIFMQHDPSAWRRSILPHTHAQLTLSGHTHGGQMQILGWRPTMITTPEDKGLYESHGRYLYVSAGLGGLVPFRLNMPNEITVITLHRK